MKNLNNQAERKSHNIKCNAHAAEMKGDETCQK